MGLKNLFKKTDINEIVKDGKEVVKTISAKEHGSRRHETDMLSDNKLSKNIRPVIVLWTFGLLTLMIIAIVFFKIEFPQEIKNTIFIAIIIELGFYFPGRTIEKWIKTKLK